MPPQAACHAAVRTHPCLDDRRRIVAAQHSQPLARKPWIRHAARNLVQGGLITIIHDTPAGTRETYQQLLTRIRQVPGVEADDITNMVPLDGGDNSGPFWIGTAQPASLQEAPHALYFWTGPDYLKTMGIPLLQGRFFTAADQVATGNVVVIDSVLAETFFHGQNPVGQTLTVGHWGVAHVVGVVGHVRHWGLDDPGTYNPRQIYIPIYQLPDSMVTDFFRSLTILVRTKLPRQL